MKLSFPRAGLLVTAGLMFFFSCKKTDITAPVITMISPTEGQLLTGGQTVNIKATAVDETGIHMVHIAVTDASTGFHIMHVEEHFDGKTYNYNQTFTVQAGKTYKIEIDAADHANNITTKELSVSAN